MPSQRKTTTTNVRIQLTSDTILFVKAFGVWLVLLLAAFINGAIRETFIVPRVGEQIGHIIGVVVFSGAIVGITNVFVKYVMREPWEKLLADYNVSRARLLIVVWLTTLVSPLVCGQLFNP